MKAVGEVPHLDPNRKPKMEVLLAAAAEKLDVQEEGSEWGLERGNCVR